LAVGAIAAIVSVLLLLSEQSFGRSLLHVLIVALLLGVVMTSTRMLGLPQPDPGNASLGLRPKDDEQGKSRKGGPGQRNEPPKNDALEFEDNYDSQGRRVPVAVVLLHDDYSPPTDLYYFRQSAFSQWNGRRLVSAVQPGIDDDLAPGFVLSKTKLPEVPNVRDDRVVLDTTVALLSEHNRPFALESPIAVEPADNPDPGRFRRVYRVTSAALSSSSDRLLGRGVGNPEWDEAARTHYLELPEDPRYQELAASIASELPPTLAADPVAQAMMVSLYLGREGVYSLKSGHAAADDPTGDFLFGDKVGYCVHFAHAAAFLMRSLGIPARVAAGYAIEEAARQGGSAILLTGAHSHAWPEVYVTGVGWTVLDVFPERSLDPPVNAPDPDLQRLLGEMARGQRPLPQGEDRPLEPIAALLRALPGLLGRLLLVLVPCVIFFGYLIKLWRSFVPYVARRAAPRVVYRAALDRLSEISIAREHGETREAFAARIAGMPAFSRLTAEHVRACFGPGASQAPAELLALLRSARRERAALVPFLRRARGVLRPFSWLRSR
jgi:transglutaminase-like putative cysteine protease